MPKRTALFCSMVLVSATTSWPYMLQHRVRPTGQRGTAIIHGNGFANLAEIASNQPNGNSSWSACRAKGVICKGESYGERLVRDHQMADGEVTALAQKRNIELVAPQPRTSDEAQKLRMQDQMAAMLNSMSGREFDSTFLQTMVQGHQDAIAMLTNAEGQLSSPVKDLVTNLLLTVRQHEMMAADLEKSTT